MRRIGLIIVAVLAILLPAGLLSAPAGATTLGQDPGIYHDCWATPGGSTSTNFTQHWANCQSNYDVWTVANEVEQSPPSAIASGVPCKSGLPAYQVEQEYSESNGLSSTTPDGVLTTGTGPYTEEIAVTGTNSQAACTNMAAGEVWNWNAFLDHDTDPKAGSGGHSSTLSNENGGNGAGNGGPLPSPSTAQVTANVLPTDYLTNASQNETGAAEYMGYWDSCMNYVEAVFSTNNFANNNWVLNVWHISSGYTLLDQPTGCMNYVGINLDAVDGLGGGVLVPTTCYGTVNGSGNGCGSPGPYGQSVTINWGDIIGILQSYTDQTALNLNPPAQCLQGTAGATTTCSGTTPMLPAYTSDASTDALGFATQTSNPVNGTKGGDTGLYVNTLYENSVSGQTNPGS